MKRDLYMSKVSRSPKQTFCFYVTTIILIFGISIDKLAAQENYVELEQGWNEADSQKAHRWNLGTELMPVRWFAALEQDDSNLKFSAGLERFGFVVKADGVPIGVTFDENEVTEKLYGEKRWVGVNCAACHTSAIEVGGKTVLINGNQGQLNPESAPRI